MQLVVQMLDDDGVPFHELFQRWSYGDKSQDPHLTEELKQRYRSAWSRGDWDDITCVLDFIRLSQDIGALDIILNGIEHEEEQIATHAVSTASSLIMRGHDFGPEIRDLLKRFAERFPTREATSWAALEFLNVREDQRRE
jgi:hypothetical protein